MELKDLKKMTVKNLREEAQKHAQISGVTGMKKDELVEALREALGIEKPKKVVKASAKRTKADVKDDLKKFKGLRIKALEDNDHKELKRVRYHIKRLKRELRKIIIVVTTA